MHTILPFLNSGLFTNIIITVPDSKINFTEELLSPYITSNIIRIINGGDTRQKSVLNALLSLKKVNPDFVLIHDGARPWVIIEIIEAVLDKIYKKKACIPVIKARDAMKKIINADIINEHLNREEMFCAQTPQGFNYEEILKAHKSAVLDNITYIDDSEIYSKYIGPVYTVDGDVRNRKITYKNDLEL